MSGTTEEEKPEAGKTFPLDLAAKITTVKAVDVKTPILMTGQPLRNMRVLTQPVPGSSGAIVAPTIITTNIVPQAIIKQCDTNRNNSNTQLSSTSITLQRPAQITIAASVPMVAQSTYHVPRGPAVVANLAAPRGNVPSAIRTSMVVTQTSVQQSAFTRPPRIPSPAQTNTWLTSTSSNTSHIKPAPSVLSSPVRSASVTSAVKPQLLTRTQPASPIVSPIRPATATILHSAITIGQGAQIHPYKPGQGTPVTLTQVLPSRSQTLVYSASSNGAHFSTAPRMAITTSAPLTQRTTPKPTGPSTATRLSMPLTVTPAPPRLIAPPTAIRSQHPLRIVSTTASNAAIARNISASVVAGQTQVTSANVLGQTRISTLSLHPLVAVTNNAAPRSIQTQAAKVITQPVQANTIHLPQISTVMKSAPIVTTATRTINVQQTNIVTQRPLSTGSAQTVSISKVFSQVESTQTPQPAANIFIHAPIAAVPRKSSPGPPLVAQAVQTTTIPTTTVSTYSLASGAYFYDASGTYSLAPHPFSQQSSFAAVPQSIRPPTLTTQVHGIVTNRFNPVMVVEQQQPSVVQPPVSTQQPHQHQQVQELPQEQPAGKLNSSPRPSILRKRDHEGVLLKAAKNLAPALGIVPLQQPLSPPSRPDSGGNEHSSGGSTTVSATSSPGLAEVNDDSMPASNLKDIKEDEENTRPALEMSPRKKPRKQQLTGNDMNEPLQEDIQFISETVKKEDSDGENRRVLRKPPNASLLNSYRQTWKATHNHYVRYSDVRPKDERRPSIMDLSNQYRVLDKVNGWKVHHLSTQMEDLAEQEQNVYNKLTELLKDTEAEEGNGFDTDLNRINELIKGNLQRIQVINVGMNDAKTQIMKIFDHKMHVADIISRCASKRNFKKREKS